PHRWVKGMCPPAGWMQWVGWCVGRQLPPRAARRREWIKRVQLKTEGGGSGRLNGREGATAMKRKSKLLIGGVMVAVLGVGTTFAIAQYSGGFQGHGGMSAGRPFLLVLFFGDGWHVDRALVR